MTTEAVESAFRAASAALDEAWRLVREWRAETPAYRARVDTLSTSLAHPEAFQIEMTLSNARIVIQNDGDRAALILIARLCEERGVIDAAGRDRLIKEFST